MKYLLIILLIVGCDANAQKKDSTLGNALSLITAASITTSSGLTTIKSEPQYDTVDVICLVSDTVGYNSISINPVKMQSSLQYDGNTIMFTFAIKAKAVREITDSFWDAPTQSFIRHKSEIIKYIGIPSRYIIWQTKILK